MTAPVGIRVGKGNPCYKLEAYLKLPFISFSTEVLVTGVKISHRK